MRNFLALLILYLPVKASAQAPVYPQNYFRNPLDIPILLAGNFGECRPGHFHSGIDIKTQGKENMIVRAAADGYISRIKMEPGGFGHALYISHPNGYTTLYAHLNDFIPEVQTYVRNTQYNSESWTQDITLKPEQFPVKQGDQIAWSGNTGGSTAPHLHFEIRDTKTEHPLNPQLFGFKVDDSQAPKIQKLVLYSMDNGFYQSTPTLFSVSKSGLEYKLSSDTLRVPASLAGIGLVVDDYMDGSSNTLAFYTADWFVDDQLQGRIRLDDIGYDETRYVNAYADYRSKQNGQPWIQCLFQLQGNRLNKVYESLNGDRGLLSMANGAVQNVRIELRDVAGNLSVLKFKLSFESNRPAINSCSPEFEPLEINRIDTSGLSLETDNKAFYSQVCVAFERKPELNALSDRFLISEAAIPVHTPMLLRLKGKQNIPFALRSKVVLVRNDGDKMSGVAAKPIAQGNYEAKVRALGEYRLVADTVAPMLEVLGTLKSDMSAAKSIRFRIKEELTSVRNVRAELDGKWILFEQHEDIWTYVFDDHCKKGRHQLRLKAEDENGNVAVKEFSFSR